MVLAGGRSARFGSDKALAEIDGHTLIALAVERLAGWCQHVVVAGRETAPAPTLPDWPAPGHGPLGGIAAGLRHAADAGCEAVMSIGVDSLGLPDDLPTRLAPGPACLASQPVVGLWPSELAATVEAILHGNGSRAMQAFADMVGARRVTLPRTPANINTPADLEALRRDR